MGVLSRKAKSWRDRNRSPFGKHALASAGLYVDLDDVEWEPDGLEQRWQAWQAAKIVIDRDYRAEQLKRLEEIGRIVEIDKQQMELDHLRLEQDERARLAALEEAAIHRRYLQAAFAAEKRIADRRLAVRWARVKKAGKEIQRHAARLEREELIRRGVLKRRR